MPEQKLTEAIVAGLLRGYLERTGNGGSGEYAYLTQVRNGAGFNSNRTFDAVSVDLFPSRGLGITVYEIKVSRADWLSELSKPDKAEDAAKVADRFVIVAPPGIVQGAELPPSWGLLQVYGEGTDEKPWKIRSKSAGEWLRKERPPVDRGFLVGLLRACPDAIPGGKVKSASLRELEVAESKGYKSGHEDGMRQADRSRQGTVTRLQEELDRWNELGPLLVKAGAKDASYWTLKNAAPQIAAALNGEATARNLDSLVRVLEDTLRTLRPLTTSSTGDTMTS